MAGTTRTRHVAAVGIVVQDLDKAIDFYTSIIGMEEGATHRRAGQAPRGGHPDLPGQSRRGGSC